MINITLGKEYKDKITGFTGIATGRAEYLTGCTQYCLVPSVDEKGNTRDGQWFDEGRLVYVGEGIDKAEVLSEKNGGPNRDCPK